MFSQYVDGSSNKKGWKFITRMVLLLTWLIMKFNNLIMVELRKQLPSVYKVRLQVNKIFGGAFRITDRTWQ